ncbi:MAG: hypothetical protein KA242_01290 [Chitinophagales bacterium]|nr:hypothetical protein [Chitinophagales bacterium]
MILHVFEFVYKTIAVAISFIVVSSPIVVVLGVVHFVKHRNKTEEPTEL